jgi:hypothetical protein
MSDYSGKPHSAFRFRNILYAKGAWRATVTINRPTIARLNGMAGVGDAR